MSGLQASCKYCDILIPDLSGKGQCWGDICSGGKSSTEATMELQPCSPSADCRPPASHVPLRVLFLRPGRSAVRFYLSVGRISSVEPSTHSRALSGLRKQTRQASHLQKGRVARPTQTPRLPHSSARGEANFPVEEEGNIIKGSFPSSLWRWMESMVNPKP